VSCGSGHPTRLSPEPGQPVPLVELVIPTQIAKSQKIFKKKLEAKQKYIYAQKKSRTDREAVHEK